MQKKSKMSLKRATALMTVFTLVLGSAVATDFTYNKDDGTAYADGLIVNGNAEDIDLPLATMPQIVTDGTVEYNLAGNAWYGIGTGDGYWTLVDTDAALPKNDGRLVGLQSVWSNGPYNDLNAENGQGLLDYTNGLVDKYLSDLKGAIKTTDVAVDFVKYDNLQAPTALKGSVNGAYLYPLSYTDFIANKTVGGKIFKNADNNRSGANGVAQIKGESGAGLSDSDVWTRTFSGIGSYSGRYAWYVGSTSGALSNHYVSDLWRVAPAFNLDVEDVLIARSAQSPQSFGEYDTSADVGNVLVAQSETYNPNFRISNENGTNVDGKVFSAVNGQYTLLYSNANVGDVISAIVYDKEGNIKYYGSLGTADTANGSVTLDLTSFADGEYTIALFAENTETHLATTAAVSTLTVGTVKGEYETFTDAKTGITWNYTVVNDGPSKYIENLHTLNGNISQIIDKDGVLNIPESINGTPVKSIGTGKADTPFIPASINGYTSINFPSGLKEIKAYAFAKNTASARITIPAQIETIGEYAFNGCDSMTEISIETSKEDVYAANKLTIKSNAFSYDSSLKSVSIAPSNTLVEAKQITIEEDAFAGDTSLRKVILSGNIEVGEYAFSGDTALDAVSLTGPALTIKGYAFNKCTSIEKLNIPKEVTLEAYAFNSCTGLRELKINTEKVPNWSFADCANISKVVFGNDVSTVEYAWGGTSTAVLGAGAESIETTIDVNSSLTCFQMYKSGTNYYSAFMGWKDGNGSHSARNVSVKYPEAKNTSVQNGDNGAKGYPAYLIFNPGAASGGETVDMTAYTANGSISVSGNKSKDIETTEPEAAVRNGFDVYYNGKVYSVSADGEDNRKDDKTGKYVFDKSKFSVVPTFTDATTGEAVSDFHFFNLEEAQATVSKWIEETDSYTYKNVTGVGDTEAHNWAWYKANINNKSSTDFKKLLEKQKAAMVQDVFDNKDNFLTAIADIVDEKASVEKIPTGESSIMQTLTVIYYTNADTSVDPDYNDKEPAYYTMTVDVKVVEYSEEQEFFDKGFTYASVMKEYNKLDEQAKEFEASVKETINSINSALEEKDRINADDYDNVNEAYKAAMAKLQEVIAGANQGSQTLADAIKAAKEAQEAQAKAEENLKKIEAEYAKLAETYKDLLANSKTDGSGYITETENKYTVVIGSTIYDCEKTGKTYTDANGTYDIYTYTDDNGVKHYIYADANGVHELTIKADNIENGQIKEDITPDNKDTTLEKEPEDIESSQAVVMQRKLLAQITALSEKLNGLESSLNDIAADLSQWITGFDANAFDKLTSEEKAQKIKEAVEALNKAYTTVKADYDKLNGAYSDIANANNKLTETNNKLNTAVDAFEKLQKGQADKEALTNAYNSFNTSYTELNTVYETLNKQYETIKGVSGTIDAAVTALNNSKAQLDVVADSLTKAYNALGSDSFESAYDELNTAKGGLTASVAELNKASKELNTALEQLQGNVTNYQTALSNIRKALGLTPSSAIDVSDITAKIEELSNGFAGLDDLTKQLKDLGIDIDENADDKLDAVINAVTALNNKYTALTSDYNKIVRKIYGADDTVDLSNKTVAEILAQIDAMSGDTAAIQKQLQEALTGETVDADKVQSLGVLITQVETMRTDLSAKANLLQQIMDALGVTDSAQILQSIVTLQNKVTELEKQVANGSGSSNVDYTGVYQSGYTAGYSAGLKENVKGNDSELAKKVTELTEKTESLASENGTLKSDKANLESRVNALSSENATLQSDKANLAAQVNALNSENATLRAVNDTLNNSVSSLNSQIAALNDSNNSLQEQITALQSRVNNVNVPTATTTTTTTTAGNKTENKATTTKATVKNETKTEEETTKAAEIKVEPATKETEEETTKAANMTAIGGVTLNKPGKTGTENSENFAANGEEEAQHSNKLAAIGAFVAGFAALAGGLAYMFVIRPKKHAVPATNFSANDEFDDEDEDLEADTEE